MAGYFNGGIGGMWNPYNSFNIYGNPQDPYMPPGIPRGMYNGPHYQQDDQHTQRHEQPRGSSSIVEMAGPEITFEELDNEQSGKETQKGEKEEAEADEEQKEEREDEGKNSRKSKKGPIKPKEYRARASLFEQPEHELLDKYKLSKPLIEELLDEIGPWIEKSKERKGAVPADTMILTMLRLYTSSREHKEYVEEMGLSQPSIYRVHMMVTDHLTRPRMIKKHIKFPREEEELEMIKKKFLTIAGLPNVIGVVGTTTIQCRTMHKAYLDSKKVPCIRIQLVCDADFFVRDAVVKWPASATELHIWSKCALRTKLRQHNVNGWLIGGKSYPLSKYILTPVEAPTSAAEFRFNEAHAKTLRIFRRTVELLKSRFERLNNTQLYQPKTVVKLIMSCLVLHNRCLASKVPVRMEDLTYSEPDQQISESYCSEDEDIEGRQMRNELIMRKFQTPSSNLPAIGTPSTNAQNVNSSVPLAPIPHPSSNPLPLSHVPQPPAIYWSY